MKAGLISPNCWLNSPRAGFCAGTATFGSSRGKSAHLAVSIPFTDLIQYMRQ
jgi:hypothetical protein